MVSTRACETCRVAFWRKDDRNLQPPPVEKVIRRAVYSSRRHSPFLQKRTVRMSHPTTRRNRHSYIARPTRRAKQPILIAVAGTSCDPPDARPHCDRRHARTLHSSLRDSRDELEAARRRRLDRRCRLLGLPSRPVRRRAELRRATSRDRAPHPRRLLSQTLASPWSLTGRCPIRPDPSRRGFCLSSGSLRPPRAMLCEREGSG